MKGFACLRPPTNFSARETSQAEPIAAAVISQKFKSRAGAISENEDAARHGMFVELISTDSGERIDAFAEIDGFAGEEDSELRKELDHRS